MRTARLVALAALLAVGGCNLTLDPDAVKPAAAKRGILRGACVGPATGHRACGGIVSQGAGEGAAAGGHRIARARVSPAAVPQQASARFKVLYAHVSQ